MSAKDHFGPYALIAPIAQNGISVSHAVEIAVRPRIDRLAVLTLVQQQLTAQPEFTDALLQSVRETELLNHPNIARVFDYGVRDGHHYLLSEFNDGRSLQDLRDHPGLSDDMAVYIVSQLAIAVAHAHARRAEDGSKVEVIHGDIRPAHVQITPQGAVKLGGYAIGSARAALGDDPVSAAAQPRDLFAYTEPAQARGEAPTTASDLFSLGALLWSLLAKKPLFDGADAQQTREAAKAGDIQALEGLRPDLDAELRSIITRAFGQEAKGQRPINNAQGLRSALASWLRKNDIKIGRPQVKDTFADAFSDAQPWGKTRPLTAREFKPNDPHSLLHPDAEGADDPGVSVAIDTLWDVDLSAAAAAAAATAAPAPSAAPSAPPTRGVTTRFAPENFDQLTGTADDASAKDEVLDLQEDLVSETPAPAATAPPAPAKAFDGPPTREVPRADLPPQRTQDDRTEEKPGLAQLLAASRASQALRGNKDAQAAGLPPRDDRATENTPPTGGPAVPPPRKSAPAKKGSLSADDIRPSDEAFATRETPAAQRPQTPAPPPAVAPASAAPAPTPSAAPTRDTPAPTDDTIDPDATVEAPAPDDATVEAAPRTLAAREDAPPEEPKEKTYDFDPNAIYEEDSEVTDYTQHYADTYDDYDDHDATPQRKRKINPVIVGLAIVVVALIGYIAFSSLSSDGDGIAASETPAALRVESKPGRAHIFIDGEDTGEVTPHTFNDFSAGSKVTVHVSRSGYEDSPEQSIELESGSAHTERFELVSLKHTINLTSEPEGATVFIDGDEQGTTPTVIGPIEANPTLGVNIHLKLDGHRPRAIQHTWTGEERTSDVNITLDPL